MKEGGGRGEEKVNNEEPMSDGDDGVVFED